MQEIEREAAAPETEGQAEKNRGGAAPPSRQCRRILESGERCRDWEVRGQGLCFRHGRWEGTRRQGPITVPLLEDEESIRMVVSQTVRAMSVGTIPPSNGRVILMGCREARGLLQDKVAAQRLAVQMKRWKVELEDPAPEPVEVVENAGGEWLAPVFDEKEVLRQWEAERAAWHAARDQERAAEAAAKAAAQAAAERAAEKPAEAAAGPEDHSSAAETVPESRAPESLGERPAIESAAESAGGIARDSTATESTMGIGSESGLGETEPISYTEWARMRLDQLPQERGDANDPPEPDALWLPNSTAQFRDLKKNWDMALNRSENERRDMHCKRHGETREEFLEARARPYEAYFETPPEGRVERQP